MQLKKVYPQNSTIYINLKKSAKDPLLNSLLDFWVLLWPLPCRFNLAIVQSSSISSSFHSYHRGVSHLSFIFADTLCTGMGLCGSPPSKKATKDLISAWSKTASILHNPQDPSCWEVRIINPNIFLLFHETTNVRCIYFWRQCLGCTEVWFHF